MLRVLDTISFYLIRWAKVLESMSFFTWKKFLIIGFIAVLLAVIPLTVSFLQKITQTQSKATAATIFCFTLPTNNTCLTAATPIQKNVGDTIPLDIWIDPNTNLPAGQTGNSIVVATVSINYNQTILTADPSLGAGLGFNIPLASATSAQGFTQTLVDPSYTPGNASVTLTVGTDALKAISQKTKIATITFKVLAPTTGANITFDSVKSNATSTVDPEVNVLSTMQPATVKIGQGTTPTVTPPVGGTVTPNQVPICTGLNVDRATTGPTPFSITFTANGNDPDPTGTISSVTFDFGDGPVETITTGGNIGTRTVSVAKSHTYNNPTTFSAKVTFTDNNGGLSAASSACAQTITVTAGPSGNTGGATGSATPTLIVEAPTETPTPTPLPPKTFETPPGPGISILGIGAIGAVLTVVGAVAFFAL